MPLARYGSRTFLSDPPALADREPTVEQLAFVKALNRKFKGLRGELDADFRAYCGGAAGFVVRRFERSCAPADEDADMLSKYRPIGMGPKGLEKYFTKHYGITWASFLNTPSDDLRSTLKRTPKPAKAVRVSTQTPKAAEEVPVRKKPKPVGRPAAARPAARATQKRASTRVSTGRAAKVSAATRASAASSAASPAASPAAATKTAPTSKPAKGSTRAKATTRQPSTRPVKQAANHAATDPSLDQAERDMAELKALLTQAIKN